MTYEEWCQQFVEPIVDQYFDGVITLDEMTSVIYNKIVTGGGLEPNKIKFEQK